MRQSSSEHDSIGSRDTGIDLNPDDVPVGYHPSVDRLSVHQRRSRSVTASRSAVGDNVPRVIDADDETDDPASVIGKDTVASSSRRSTSQRSASFDKTMEWLMTRTGRSKCPANAQARYTSLSRSNSPLRDDEDAASATAHACDDAKDPVCRPEIIASSRLSSPSRSISQPRLECTAAEGERLTTAADNLNVGLRHRIADTTTTAAAAEPVSRSEVADYRQHQHSELNSSRQSLMSVADSDINTRNRQRRSKPKVFFKPFSVFV